MRERWILQGLKHERYRSSVRPSRLAAAIQEYKLDSNWRLAKE